MFEHLEGKSGVAPILAKVAIHGIILGTRENMSHQEM